MRIDFDLSMTIDKIYACVGNPNGFNSALRRIRADFGAARVALVTRLASRACFYYEDRCDGTAGPRGASQASGALDGGSSNFGTAHLAGTVCSSFCGGQQARRLCCCIEDRSSGSAFPSIHLSVQRREGSRPFEELERRALETLAHHVLRALHLSNRVDAAEAASDVGSQVLEELSRGVVVLNGRKELVFMNRRAEAICFAGRGIRAVGLTSGHRTLKAASPAEDEVLQRVIDDAFGPDSEPALSARSSKAVRIDHGPARRPLLIRVARLPPASGGQRHTVLFIDDLVAKALGDDRLLTALFALTKAEARVASALLSGERPKEIAARFSVSEDTVRTQLKAIYVKTGTGGLSSLLALLTRLADMPVVDVCESAAGGTLQRIPSSDRTKRAATSVGCFE